MKSPLRNQIFDCQNGRVELATQHNRVYVGDSPIPLRATIRAAQEMIQTKSEQERELNVITPLQCSPSEFIFEFLYLIIK